MVVDENCDSFKVREKDYGDAFAFIEKLLKDSIDLAKPDDLAFLESQVESITYQILRYFCLIRDP